MPIAVGRLKHMWRKALSSLGWVNIKCSSKTHLYLTTSLYFSASLPFCVSVSPSLSVFILSVSQSTCLSVFLYFSLSLLHLFLSLSLSFAFVFLSIYDLDLSLKILICKQFFNYYFIHNNFINFEVKATTLCLKILTVDIKNVELYSSFRM